MERGGEREESMDWVKLGEELYSTDLKMTPVPVPNNSGTGTWE